jgi:hypothetical protein
VNRNDAIHQSLITIHVSTAAESMVPASASRSRWRREPDAVSGSSFAPLTQREPKARRSALPLEWRLAAVSSVAESFGAEYRAVVVVKLSRSFPERLSE